MILASSAELKNVAPVHLVVFEAILQFFVSESPERFWQSFQCRWALGGWYGLKVWQNKHWLIMNELHLEGLRGEESLFS